MRTGGATTTSTRNCESWCTSVSEGDPCISDDCNGCPECNHACVAPTTTGYDVTETSLTMDTFDVTALCATGYEGSVTVAKCDAHGQAYRLPVVQRNQLDLTATSLSGLDIARIR